MTFVLRPTALVDPELDCHGVRVALVEAFEKIQSAILEDQAVVVVVAAGDLLGHFGPERATLVGGLVGIARAVAFEGARPDWRINVIALPEGLDADDAEVVGEVPASARGQVITLGASLIGKVAP